MTRVRRVLSISYRYARLVRSTSSARRRALVVSPRNAVLILNSLYNILADLPYPLSLRRLCTGFITVCVVCRCLSHLLDILAGAAVPVAEHGV